MAGETQGEKLARIEGKLDTAHAQLSGEIQGLRKVIEGSVRELAGEIRFGDSTNATLIAGNTAEIKRAHDRLNAMEKRSDDNRRLIYASFIAPLVTGILLVIILSQLKK